MEFLKTIVRGILKLIDLTSSVFAVLCVLFVLGILVYNGMYITAFLMIATIVAVFIISKKYHGR